MMSDGFASRLASILVTLATRSCSDFVLGTKYLSYHIPTSPWFDQTATLSVSLGTAWHALYMQSKYLKYTP